MTTQTYQTLLQGNKKTMEAEKTKKTEAGAKSKQ
jgi:hypothetical protein